MIGWELYIDGILRTITASNSSLYNYNITQTQVYVSANDVLSESFYGYLAEIRIINGASAFTKPFTVPSSPFDYPKTYSVYNDLYTCAPSVPNDRLFGQVYDEGMIKNEPWVLYDGGTYEIKGTVTYSGEPVSRKVSLLSLKDKRLLAETWSNSVTGYYEFLRLKDQEYIIWCEDYLRVYDPITHIADIALMT